MADTPLVLNICGEGEIEGAINLNNLAATMKSVETIERSGVLINSDVLLRWPIADDSIDLVVGNNIPGFDRSEREIIAREAFRVLKTGGYLKLHSMSGKINDWEATMRTAGLVVLRRESVGFGLAYAVALKSGGRP